MALVLIFIGLSIIGLGLCISSSSGWSDRDYISDFEYPDEDDD